MRPGCYCTASIQLHWAAAARPSEHRLCVWGSAALWNILYRHQTAIGSSGKVIFQSRQVQQGAQCDRDQVQLLLIRCRMLLLFIKPWVWLLLLFIFWWTKPRITRKALFFFYCIFGVSKNKIEQTAWNMHDVISPLSASSDVQRRWSSVRHSAGPQLIQTNPLLRYYN